MIERNGSMKKSIFRNIYVAAAFLMCSNMATGIEGNSSIFNHVQSVEASTITAKPTSSEVLVNGKSVKFDAYNINDNNYFKLRDIAHILSGTSNQFEVTWDNDNSAIKLIPSMPYTAIGGELGLGDGTSKTAKLNTSAIYLNNYAINLTAYTINNVNYFKLRDLGDVFGFNVDWDNNSQKVLINTSDNTTGNTSSAKTDEELIGMYKVVFDMYWNLKNNGEVTSTMSDIMRYYTNESINNLGYEFIDVDGDGLKELFIGDNESNEQYLASYYIKDGEVKYLGSINERYGDTLKSDLTFYSYGSDSAAMYSMIEIIFKNGTFSGNQYAHISDFELNPGEVEGIYYINGDGSRRIATSAEVASLEAMKAKSDHVFNFKPLYTDATKVSNTATNTTNSKSYASHEGVNVAKLNVNDKVGDFTVKTVEVDDSYISEGFYNTCNVSLSGDYKTNITAIEYNDYIGTFVVSLSNSPISINMNANHNQYLVDFSYISVKQELLEKIFHKSDLENIKADKSGDMGSAVYYAEEAIPIKVTELNNYYMANTSGWSNYCVIEPDYY